MNTFLSFPGKTKLKFLSSQPAIYAVLLPLIGNEIFQKYIVEILDDTTEHLKDFWNLLTLVLSDFMEFRNGF